MHKNLFLVLFLLIFFFTFPGKAFAALYINEFSSNSSPEWIEIYNSDSASVDLSNYIIRDSTDSHKIDLTGSIAGNGFATFEFSGSVLNNDGDKIRLLVKNEGGVENSVSEVVYGVPGDVKAPASDQTAGRNPDGTSNWVLFSASSRNSSNNSSAVVPTPTSAPTDTPSPSKTPTPTQTPTPGLTMTPTKSPTLVPSKITSPTIAIKITPSPTVDPNSDLKLENSNDSKVFGDSSESPTPADGEVLGTSTSQAPLLFIVLGLIFLVVCGILVYLQFGDRILLRLRKRSE